MDKYYDIIQTVAIVGTIIVTIYSLLFRDSPRKVRKYLIWILIAMTGILLIANYLLTSKNHIPIDSDSNSNIGSTSQMKIVPEDTNLVEQELSEKSFVIDSLGYGFYGVLNSDKSWSEFHFVVENTQRTWRLPIAGDIIRCTADINVRSGYIAFIPNKGWSNRSKIGVILKNERVKVLETNVIYDQYVWIKFQKL